jgi:hypothetical protein
VAVLMSAILFAVALVLYLPVILAPEQWGGDMIGLASIAIAVTTTAIVVAISGLTALRSRLRRAHGGSRC